MKLHFRREFSRLFPAFLFFLFAFTLINFTEGLMMRHTGIPPYSPLEVLIAAGVVAKVLLIVDHLPWTSPFPKIPLIYNTVWKVFLYGFFIMILRGLHRFLPFWHACPTGTAAWESFVTELNWPKFWALELWYLMVLFIFVTARELNDALGGEAMKKLFFGKK